MMVTPLSLFSTVMYTSLRNGFCYNIIFTISQRQSWRQTIIPFIRVLLLRLLLLLCFLRLLIRLPLAHKVVVHRVTLEWPGSDGIDHIIIRDRLLLQKQFRQGLHLVFLLPYQLHRPRVRLIHDLPRLLVHRLGGRVRVWLLRHSHLILIFGEGQLAHPVVHTIELYGAVNQLRHPAQVVRRPSGHPAEEHLLGCPPRQGHLYDVHDLLLRPQKHLLWEILRVSQRAVTTGDDGHFQKRVSVLQEPPRHGVPRLVVGDDSLLVVGHDLVALKPADDAVSSLLEVVHRHGVGLAPGGDDRSLVAHVGDVGACEPRGEPREPACHVRCLTLQLDPLQVDQEHLLPSLEVW
mmetsp:Transcript_8616/g.18527  ORF Transcript_8616/g.18527 Transcript_8616/m.18527 type:complete len:348 (-) Transcript_8616:579-1622(-)